MADKELKEIEATFQAFALINESGWPQKYILRGVIMKTIILTILTLSTVFVLNLMTPPQAAANTYSCTIRGGKQEAYVVVTDMDRDGNPLRQRGELFQGVLKPNETQTLNSTFGELRYSFKRYNQLRSQGRIYSDCKGNTIRLPWIIASHLALLFCNVVYAQ